MNQMINRRRQSQKRERPSPRLRQRGKQPGEKLPSTGGRGRQRRKERLHKNGARQPKENPVPPARKRNEKHEERDDERRRFVPCISIQIDNSNK